MDDKDMLEQKIDSLKELIYTEIGGLKKDVAQINTHIEDQNGKVFKNYDWITRHDHDIECLIGEKDSRLKKYSDLIYKLAIIGLVSLVAGQTFGTEVLKIFIN